MNTDKRTKEEVVNNSNHLHKEINLIEKQIKRVEELLELHKKQKLDLELKIWNGNTPHPDFIQQVKEETIERYVDILYKIGLKEGLIDVYDKLKYDFDLESHEISEWYEEDKEELPKLYKWKDELEKKIKITHK